MEAIIKIDGSLVAEAGKVLEKFGLPGFVSSVLGVPQDYIERWRSQNLLKWYGEYQQLCIKRASAGQSPPPPSLLVPALRAIVDEDDVNMLSLWARLMAGFNSSPLNGVSRKIFIRLLSEMESVDAQLLILLCGTKPVEASGEGSRPGRLEAAEISWEDAASSLKVSNETIQVSAGNLARLSCLRQESRATRLALDGPDVLPMGAMLYTSHAEYYPTELATSLLQALSLSEIRVQRRSFATADLTAEQVKAIASARMDPHHAHLDALLDP